MGIPPQPPGERLVVGGGVIGLAVAFELASRGHAVRLIERDAVGSGASDVAAGMLAPVSEAELGPEALVRLGLESLRRYPEFVKRIERATGIDCGYRTEGTLWIALNRDDRAELSHLEATLRSLDLSVRRLDAAAVGELEPHLSPRVTGGLLVAGDHQVDPRKLVQALRAALVELGGRIEEGLTVERIDPDGTVLGRHDDGRAFTRHAASVILAAGAWCDQVVSQVGVSGIRPVKGQLLRLRGPRLISRVLRTPHVYLIPREDGELLVGATSEEMGFDRAPTAGAAHDLLRRAFELLPGIYELELAEINVGLRPALADHLPAIGPVDQAGPLLAIGHYRQGILLAPVTAHYLADWLEGERSTASLEPFLPRHVRTGVPVAAPDGGGAR